MFLWYEYNVTTIPVESKVLAEVEVLKLKTCRLYHENILLQKIKDVIFMFLKTFFQPLTSLRLSEAIFVSMV